MNKQLSGEALLAAIRRAQQVPVKQATYVVCPTRKASGAKKVSIFNPMLRVVAPGSVR